MGKYVVDPHQSDFFSADAGITSATHYIVSVIRDPDLPEGVKPAAKRMYGRITDLARDMGVQADVIRARARARTAEDSELTRSLRWIRAGLENVVRFLADASRRPTATAVDIVRYRRMSAEATDILRDLDRLERDVKEQSNWWYPALDTGRDLTRGWAELSQAWKDELSQTWKEMGRNASYHIRHQPNDEGPPYHDLIGEDYGFSMPPGVLTNPRPYTGFKEYLQSFWPALLAAQGNPSARVTIYRALPSGHTTFDTGNWVTPSVEYARKHLESNVEGGHVVAATVPAHTVRFAGDDLMEWGYWGPPVEGRVVGGRTAARPIRIDRAKVDDLARRIVDQLRQLGAGRESELVGVNDVLLEDAFTGVTVDGQHKSVMILVSSNVRGGDTPFVSGGGFGKVTGGPYKGTPVIFVQLDGRNTWASVGTYAGIGKYLVGLLMHEITHALDMIRTTEGRPSYYRSETPNTGGYIPTSDEVNLVAYYNDPHEVRAYMRQVYEELRPYVHGAMQNDWGRTRGLGTTVSKLLGLSRSWKQIRPHLNRKSRNTILKGVLTAFEDDLKNGVGDTGRTAAARDVDCYLDTYGLRALVRGGEATLFHGTTRSFRRFDSAYIRHELINQFYKAPGIFLTPRREVAVVYSTAARNTMIPATVVDDLTRINRGAGEVLGKFVTQGHDVWDGLFEDAVARFPDAESPVAALEMVTGGVDTNTLMDIAKYVEGSRAAEGSTSETALFDLWGMTPTGTPDHVFTDLESVGLDADPYRPKVYTVEVSGLEQVLVTKSKSEAAQARRNGYDAVVFCGSDLVGGVPEVVVFDPSKVRITKVDVVRWEPSDDSYPYFDD